MINEIPSAEYVETIDEEEAADFETAIEACGFGFFNVCLLLVALPGIFSTIFETTTMSYVLPSAECDLKLTLMDKGALNAMAFAGTTISAIPWGFVADTYGRKRILVYGLLMAGTLTLFSTLSQTSRQLMVFKFFGGFLTCGPVAVFVAYISEFHGKKYRMYIVISIGTINSLPLVLQPVLAYLILPQGIFFYLWGIEYSSWKVFIAVTAIPALLSGFLFIFFPESPRLLMAKGKTEKALRTFQTIYTLNTGQKKDTYPFVNLLNEVSKKAIQDPAIAKFKSKFNDGLKQLQQLCSKKHIGLIFLIYSLATCILFSIHSIRLWLPQYFATSKEMEFKGGYSLSTCSVIEYALNKTKLIGRVDQKRADKCKVHIEANSYFNNIIVASVLFFNYLFTIFAVHYIGNNVLMRVYIIIASFSFMGLYASTNEIMGLIFACFVIAFGIVAVTLIINVLVGAFPTSIRTMAVILLMTCGRLGGMLGNFVLPILMAAHCIVPFACFSCALLCSFTLSFFIPNTTKDDLK